MTQPKQRITRRDRFAAMNRMAQLVRLRQIANGTRQPEWPREALYLSLFRDGLNPDPRDFVLSWALGTLEVNGMLGRPPELQGGEGDGAASEPQPAETA